MTIRIRAFAEDHFGKTGRLSLLEDILGVYGRDNTRKRSVLTQVDRVSNKPFVRVALVTVRPTNSSDGVAATLQQDLDLANDLFLDRCDVWIYPVTSIVRRTDLLGSNVLLDQFDCWIGPFGTPLHIATDEEKALFELGRGRGANIVAYYIAGSTSGDGGCAAHPLGRRGFWLKEGGSEGYAFAHEISHVLGNHGHIDGADNLMSEGPRFTNLPPNLSEDECQRIRSDPDVES